MCGFGSCGTPSDRDRTQESAKSILDMRYARGEIDRMEYEEKMSVLAAENNNNAN